MTENDREPPRTGPGGSSTPAGAVPVPAAATVGVRGAVRKPCRRRAPARPFLTTPRRIAGAARSFPDRRGQTRRGQTRRNVADLRAAGVSVLRGEGYGPEPHAPGTGGALLDSFPWTPWSPGGEGPVGDGAATGAFQRALTSCSTAVRNESSRLQKEKRTSQAGASALT